MKYVRPFCSKQVPDGVEAATWGCCGEVGRAVLPELNTLLSDGCPEYDFLRKFEQENPDIPRQDMAEHFIEHLADQLRLAEFRRISELNKQVADGINKIADAGRWTHLSGIAKHAMQECVTVLKSSKIVERNAEVVAILEEVSAIVNCMRTGLFFISDEYKNAYAAFEARRLSEGPAPLASGEDHGD